jgi:uncharacterized protein YegL
MKDMEEIKQIHESGIIVIAIDRSDSMGNDGWTKANNGAQSLINHVIKHHSDPSKMTVVILHFNSKAHFIHEGTLD